MNEDAYPLVPEEKKWKVKLLSYFMIIVFVSVISVLYFLRNSLVLDFFQILIISTLLVLFMSTVVMILESIIGVKQKPPKSPSAIALTAAGIVISVVLLSFFLQMMLTPKARLSTLDMVFLLSAAIAALPIAKKLIKIRREQGALSPQEEKIMNREIDKLGTALEKGRNSFFIYQTLCVFFIVMFLVGLYIGTYSGIFSGLFMISTPLLLFLILNRRLANKVQPSEERFSPKMLHALLALLYSTSAFFGFLMITEALFNISFAEAINTMSIFAFAFFLVYLVPIYKLSKRLRNII